MTMIATHAPLKSETGRTAFEARNAAFRDGAYAGQLAAQRGDAPHVASGRWATQADREAFTAGYERGYNEKFAQSQAGQSGRLTHAAFRDGLYLGKLDASRGRDPHIASGRWSTGEDRNAFSDGYRQAYGESVVAMR